MRRWTVDERQRQSEKIRQWQPWKESTGPKTQDGKQHCAKNAQRSGQYSVGAREKYKGWRQKFKAIAYILDVHAERPYQRFSNNFCSLTDAVAAMRGMDRNKRTYRLLFFAAVARQLNIPKGK